MWRVNPPGFECNSVSIQAVETQVQAVYVILNLIFIKLQIIRQAPYKMFLLVPYVILVMLTQGSDCLNAGLSAYEKASYSVPFDCELCDPKFNHFAIHNTTRGVYIGSSNYLVHLNSALQEVKRVSTFVPCADEINREDCINHNKLLAIYYGRDELITCGNLNGGRCQIRNTSDIAISTEVNQAVVAPGEQTTEYVIAPVSRRISQIETVDEDRLYVAATDPDNRRVPAYARRDLQNIANILTANNANTLTMHSVTPTSFFVNYMDVFNHNRYTYFATNQRFEYSSNDPSDYQEIISKLNRACHDSPDLNSYTEVVIECRGVNGDVYNLIRAAYLDTVGPGLASSIGVDSHETVLIGLFAKSLEIDDFTPANNSAICIFDLDDIEMRFEGAIEACLEGNQAHGVDYLSGKSCELVSIDIMNP